MATAAVPRVFKNFINGEWVESRSGQAYENRNPANTDELVGMFVSSNVGRRERRGGRRERGVQIVAAGAGSQARGNFVSRGRAAAAAQGRAFEGHDPRDGQGPGGNARGRAGSHRHDLLHGGEGRRLFGQTTPSELPNKFAMSARQSIGVCGMITPWNFPMAIPSWKMMPALVSGNTVVLKPAEDTPLSSYHLVQILTEAGLPHGRGEPGERRWPERGSAIGRAQGRPGGELYRFNGGGQDYRADVRAGFQALQPGNGREKHHHRDG